MERNICDCCWLLAEVVHVELDHDWAGFRATQDVQLCPNCKAVLDRGEEP
jgi:hypothetical protein